MRPTKRAGTRGTSGPNGERWMRRLASYCLRYRKNTLSALGGTLLATVVTALIPLVQRQVIDKVIITHTQSIWPLAITLAGAGLLGFGGIYLRRFYGGRGSLGVEPEPRTHKVWGVSPAPRRS